MKFCDATHSELKKKNLNYFWKQHILHAVHTDLIAKMLACEYLPI